MKVAYSYVRFSTPEQGEGDSKRRQVDLSERWATRNGYVLDKTLTLRDEGRSGFKGHHARGKGALARFLTLIRAGVIKPGSALILENLDRLSRQNINDAMKVARQILEAGVDIVTMLPEQVYTKKGLETDALTWMQLVWHFNRAHEESRRKSDLTKENWEQKRKDIAQRKLVTATRPFWLDIYQDGKPVPPGRGKVDWNNPVEFRINKKVEIVRLVFKMADQGFGSFRISKELVRRGLKFRRAEIITQATICRLLTDRKVLGEFQPRYGRDAKGDRHVAGEVVEGYFPQVIDPDLFYRVQEKMKQRLKKGRGRKQGMTNLFGGLLKDARDGGPIYVRPNRGQHFMANYWGIKGKKGSVWMDFPYKVFEDAILKACRELSPSFLLPENPAFETVRRIEGDLADVAHKIDRAQARLDGAEDEAEEEVLTAQVVRLVRRRKELEGKLETARAEVSTQPEEQLKQLHGLIDQLRDAEQGDDRERVRTMVAGLVASIVQRIFVFIQRRGKTRRYEKRCWAWVCFTNGKLRKLLIDGKTGVTVTMAYDPDEPLTPGMMSVTAEGGWE